MANARRLMIAMGIGGALGALVIGGGGRLVMRMIATLAGLPGGFSTGGTAEVLLYGALIGAAGALVGLALARVGLRSIGLGLSVGLLTFAGTLLTLPPHIAASVRPFASIMPTVLILFGACFLLYGLVMAAALERLRTREGD